MVKYGNINNWEQIKIKYEHYYHKNYFTGASKMRILHLNLMEVCSVLTSHTIHLNSISI